MLSRVSETLRKVPTLCIENSTTFAGTSCFDVPLCTKRPMLSPTRDSGNIGVDSSASGGAHLKSAGSWCYQVGAQGLAFDVRGLVKRVGSLKSWLPRVSPGAGGGSAPPRVVVSLRGFAEKSTNFDCTNFGFQRAVAGGAALSHLVISRK